MSSQGRSERRSGNPELLHKRLKSDSLSAFRPFGSCLQLFLQALPTAVPSSLAYSCGTLHQHSAPSVLADRCRTLSFAGTIREAHRLAAYSCFFGSCLQLTGSLFAGPIGEAQRLAAELFGARETWFLCNGSSGGVLASLLACVKVLRCLRRVD